VADVLEHPVPGEGAGALGVAGGRRQRGLIEDQGSAAILADPVEHADERGGEHRGAVGQQRHPDAAGGAEERDRDQGAATAEAIAGDGDQQRRQRGAGEPDADHQAGLGGIEAARGEVEAEQDPDDAAADRAQHRGRVEDAAIAHRRPGATRARPRTARSPR
jgi:hypothetical protein